MTLCAFPLKRSLPFHSRCMSRWNLLSRPTSNMLLPIPFILLHEKSTRFDGAANVLSIWHKYHKRFLCIPGNVWSLVKKASHFNLYDFNLLSYPIYINRQGRGIIDSNDWNIVNLQQLTDLFIAYCLNHWWVAVSLTMSFFTECLATVRSSACSNNNPQPCLDPPQSKGHTGQRRI